MAPSLWMTLLLNLNIDELTMKRTIIAILLLSAIITACKDDTYIPLVELGAPVKEFVMPAEGGDLKVPVYANGPFIARFSEEVDWAGLTPDRGDKDDALYVSCTRNDDILRSVKLLLESQVSSRTDTVTIVQEGVKEELKSLNN